MLFDLTAALGPKRPIYHSANRPEADFKSMTQNIQPPPGYQPDKNHKLLVRVLGFLALGGMSMIFLLPGIEGLLSGSIDVRGKTGSILYRAFRGGEHQPSYWIYTAFCMAVGSILLAGGLWAAFKRHIPEPHLPRD